MLFRSVKAAAGGGIADNNTPHTVKIEVTAININPTQRTNVFYFAKTANKSSVRGMAINGSRGTSPHLKYRNNVYVAASNVTMSCNYIGTHADGFRMLLMKVLTCRLVSTLS